MEKPEEYKVLMMMEKRGGGFASALAVAWIRADSVNRRKLRQAFADLYEEFEAMAMGVTLNG